MRATATFPGNRRTASCTGRSPAHVGQRAGGLRYSHLHSEVCSQIEQVNEAICDARPPLAAPGEAAPGTRGKKGAAQPGTRRGARVRGRRRGDQAGRRGSAVGRRRAGAGGGRAGHPGRAAAAGRGHAGRPAGHRCRLRRTADRLDDKAPGRIEKVKPAYTSQRCSACGCVDPKSRESQAGFRCTACDYTCNAGVNAARNIAAGHAVNARRGDRVAGPAKREPQELLLAG